MTSSRPAARKRSIPAAFRMWLALALMAAAGMASVQPGWSQQDAPVRVRGTIERVDGGLYIVRSREGAQLKLRLAAGGGISALVPAKLTDITVGKYIGVAGMPLADGSQKAMEIHIFSEAQRGAGEGFRPWDLVPQSTMTNANVEATVASAEGRVLTLKYKDGEKRILVPDGVPIVAFAPGDASDLKAGASIFVAAAKKLPDGTLEAARITVGRGIAPPM